MALPTRDCETMKKLRVLWIVSTAVFFATSIFAADLVEIYKQALNSDPAFKAANANWLAQREQVPLARASLLPTLSATAGYGRTSSYSESGSPKIASSSKIGYANTTSYGLSLTQPIFNYTSWANLSSARASVKQAAADFSASAQELMYRCASSYFSVLLAGDVLRYTSEQKKNLSEQLRQQKQRYAVGIVAITDVNETQASYDSIVAQEISARNDLLAQIEKLKEITGASYTGLKKFAVAVPLVNPDPIDMEQWVAAAEKQNYALISAQYAAIAAREKIKASVGGHIPTLGLGGSYGYLYSSNTGDGGSFGRSKTASAGLSLNVPLFSGGSVSAGVRQADYRYQQNIANQEKVHRSAVSNTRQAYLAVMSGISKVIADKQMLVSKRSSYESILNAYDAGMRTMSDVLFAETDLYNAEKTYAQDQYSYILSTLLLKQNVGVLSFDDLEKVNGWLNRVAVKTAEGDKELLEGGNQKDNHDKTVTHEKHGKKKSKKESYQPEVSKKVVAENKKPAVEEVKNTPSNQHLFTHLKRLQQIEKRNQAFVQRQQSSSPVVNAVRENISSQQPQQSQPAVVTTSPPVAPAVPPAPSPQ